MRNGRTKYTARYLARSLPPASAHCFTHSSGPLETGIYPDLGRLGLTTECLRRDFYRNETEEEQRYRPSDESEVVGIHGEIARPPGQIFPVTRLYCLARFFFAS